MIKQPLQGVDAAQIEDMLQRRFPNISEERQEQNREWMRSAASFEHFIDTHCKIQDRQTGKEIPFSLWPGQRQVVPIMLENLYLCVLKARQLGLTWMTAAYCLWRANFRKNELVVVISAKEDLAIEFLDRVKFMFDRLPDWLKSRVYKRSGTEVTWGVAEKDNKGNVVLGGLNSSIKSIPSTPDAGQSKTISLLVMDESALNRYCREIWSAAKPTLEHAHGQAIIISNPTKIAPGWPWTRDLYRGSMRNENEFKRIFLNWECVPGREEGFLESQRRAGLDEDDISMQYPSTEEEAISAIGGSYFGNTISRFEPWVGERGGLHRTDENGKSKTVFDPDERGILEVWEHPVTGWKDRYAIGSDVSEGLGGSYSVAYVYDRFDNRYVARLRSNKVSADLWALRLVELGQYYGDAMLGPERNGAGITTIQTLEGIYTNLFYRQRPGKLKGQYVMEYGWLQTHEAKQLLADELKRHFREVFSSCPCAALLEECTTFIRHEDGKLAHEEGKLDDCVIAAGITLQVSRMMPTATEVRGPVRVDPIQKRLEELEKGSGDDFEQYIYQMELPSDRDPWQDEPKRRDGGGRIYHDLG